MRIVVAGGTGFLGRALVARLHSANHTVVVLSRRPAAGAAQVAWNPREPAGRWTHVLDGADAVVNLTGQPIDRRWTKQYKQELWNSRVLPTRTLAAAIRHAPHPPAALVSASAVGIYGDRGDEPLTEDSRPGSGFLPSLALDWEQAALEAASTTRVVLLRSGVSLARDGGALPRIELPFRFFAGGPIGSGRQYFPWIHIDDWAAMVQWALDTPTIVGPLNIAAPEAATNREFARTLGTVLHRPAWMPVPELALKIAFGEMSDTVLASQRLVPAKACANGFRFAHPSLENALRAIYVA
jgi:uncharacterized protein (TIGR01777 family)